MKANFYFFATLVLSVILTSCKDVITETSYRNVPVYMSYDELREPVKPGLPSALVNPGKIYFKDGIIFINEEMKGVHIIDNSDPANPENIGFIAIPGNMDML